MDPDIDGIKISSINCSGDNDKNKNDIVNDVGSYDDTYII